MEKSWTAVFRYFTPQSITNYLSHFPLYSAIYIAKYPKWQNVVQFSKVAGKSKGQTTITIHCFRRTPVSSLNYPSFPPFQSKSHPLLQPQLTPNFFWGTISNPFHAHLVCKYCPHKLYCDGLFNHQSPHSRTLVSPWAKTVLPILSPDYRTWKWKDSTMHVKNVQRGKTMQVDLPMFQRCMQE